MIDKGDYKNVREGHWRKEWDSGRRDKIMEYLTKTIKYTTGYFKQCINDAHSTVSIVIEDDDKVYYA